MPMKRIAPEMTPEKQFCDEKSKRHVSNATQAVETKHAGK